VNTLEGAKAASNYGYWAAVLLACLTAIGMGLGQLGIGPNDPSQFDYEGILEVLAFATIAWGIARNSRIAVIFGLALYLMRRCGMLGLALEFNLLG